MNRGPSERRVTPRARPRERSGERPALRSGGFTSLDVELRLGDGERARVARGLRWDVRLRDGRADGWVELGDGPWAGAHCDRPELAAAARDARGFGAALADAKLAPTDDALQAQSEDEITLQESLWEQWRVLPDPPVR